MNLEKIRQLRERMEGEKGEQNTFSSEIKCALKAGYTVVRVLGDPEVCFRTWIKDVAGRNIPLIFKEGGVMMRLIKHVLDYTLEIGADGKYHRQYHFQNTNSFQVIQKGRWRPRETYVMNCIPRQPVVEEGKVIWTPAHKHTALLVQSASDIGIGPMAFSKFVEVAENFGDPEGYDVVFVRQGTGLDTKYSCQMAAAANPEYGKFVVEGPLTDEEKSYERYDLSRIVQPTPSHFILSVLGEYIQGIDQELHTQFYQELADQTANIGASNATTAAPPQTQGQGDVVSQEAMSRRVRKSEKKKEEEADPIAKTFPPDASLIPCDACGKAFPEDWTKCPYCGAEYDLVG